MIKFFIKYVWKKTWFRFLWLSGILIIPFIFLGINRDLLILIYFVGLISMCIFNEGIN